MSWSHALIDCGLWTISACWLLQTLVSMSRVKAPKRNRVLPAPSPLCERTPKFEERMAETVFAARQAN